MPLAHDFGATGNLRFSDLAMYDRQTETWSRQFIGQAIDGLLAGSQLTPIVHGNHFWFAWGVFKPDTLIYRGMA